VGFDITDQLLIRFFAFIRYWRKKWEYIETVHQLFVDFKKAFNSVRGKIANGSVGNLTQFKYLRMTAANQNLISEEIKRKFGKYLLPFIFSSAVSNVKIRMHETNFICDSVWM
jgi:hypothetical protein